MHNRWLALTVSVVLLCFVDAATGQIVGNGATLRDTPSEQAPLGLPAAFSTTDANDRTQDDSWEHTSLKASPLAVTVAHPKGWVVRGVPDGLFVALLPDGVYSFAMTVPTPTALAPLEPLTREDLGALATLVGTGYERPIVTKGQARIADRLWVWFELGVSDTTGTAATQAPPAAVQQWIFSSIIEKHQVVLALTIHNAPGTADSARDAQARHAGPIFARMIEHTSFTSSP